MKNFDMVHHICGHTDNDGQLYKYKIPEVWHKDFYD